MQTLLSRKHCKILLPTLVPICKKVKIHGKVLGNNLEINGSNSELFKFLVKEKDFFMIIGIEKYAILKVKSLIIFTTAYKMGFFALSQKLLLCMLKFINDLQTI